MILRNKNPRLILVLTAVSFIASGIDCIENNLMIIGIISIVVASLNIIASFFIQKYPFSIKIALLTTNAVFAALSSYLYFLAGLDKIPYGWALVAIINVIVIINAYRKRMKSKVQS